MTKKEAKKLIEQGIECRNVVELYTRTNVGEKYLDRAKASYFAVLDILEMFNLSDEFYSEVVRQGA